MRFNLEIEHLVVVGGDDDGGRSMVKEERSGKLNRL